MGVGISKQGLKTFKVDRIVCFRNNIPSDDWWGGFCSRHPEISLRKPEPLSTMRSRMMKGWWCPTISRNYWSWFPTTVLHVTSSGIWTKQRNSLSIGRPQLLAGKGLNLIQGQAIPRKYHHPSLRQCVGKSYPTDVHSERQDSAMPDVRRYYGFTQALSGLKRRGLGCATSKRSRGFLRCLSQTSPTPNLHGWK